MTVSVLAQNFHCRSGTGSQQNGKEGLVGLCHFYSFTINCEDLEWKRLIKIVLHKQIGVGWGPAAFFLFFLGEN